MGALFRYCWTSETACSLLHCYLARSKCEPPGRKNSCDMAALRPGFMTAIALQTLLDP